MRRKIRLGAEQINPTKNPSEAQRLLGFQILKRMPDGSEPPNDVIMQRSDDLLLHDSFCHDGTRDANVHIMDSDCCFR
jgi:hypothetical protein